MEAYKEDYEIDYGEESIIDKTSQKIKTGMGTILSLLVTIMAIIVMFVVASVEVTKEIKANSRDSIKILELWREDNESNYPKQKEELVIYKDREYFFVIDEINIETNEIIKWHFAYDGDLRYVFSEYKYWVLTGVAIVLSLTVILINFKSTLRDEMKKPRFRKSVHYYQKAKDDMKSDTHILPDYCHFKTKQTYETEKRKIVEGAGIDYEKYINAPKEIEIEKWQKRKLRKIRRIKVKGITANDLLQEYSKKGLFSNTVRMLPKNEDEILRELMISSFVKKTVSFFATGLMIAFGIILGEWVLGITYAFMVFSSVVTAIILAKDHADTTLRNRYIAKADYLIECFNTKRNYIKKEKEEIEIKQNNIEFELPNLSPIANQFLEVSYE